MTSATALSTPAVIQEMIITKAIPALDAAQRFAVTEYLFRWAATRLRILVAELAYRNPDHPAASDLFLASAMGMAQRVAQRLAFLYFYEPSEWQMECLYDGAVTGVLALFQGRHLAEPFTMEQFSSYLARSLKRGAFYRYRRREENLKMDTVARLDLVEPRKKPMRNEVEQAIITRELLEQIAQYPLLQRAMSKTLECVIELGPDFALTDRKVLPGEYNPETSKRYRGTIPSFNFEAISKKRGISRSSVSESIRMARIVLNKAFNADGRLFCAH